MFEDDDDLLTEGSFDPPEVVETFLEAWGAKDFATAYNQLASNSPLRQGLSQSEWTKSREEWAKEAKPLSIVFDIAFDYDLEPEEDDTEEEDDNKPLVVEAFWSVEKNATALDSTLEELPQATLIYPETKRNWFWAKYTVVEEDEDYRILDIDDEGSAAQQLSSEELQQRLDEQLSEVEALMHDAGVDPEANIDPDTLSDEEVMNMALGLGDPSDMLQELTWLTERGMHYSDALIAKQVSDVTLYDRAAAQAALLQDWERAAAYVTLIAERFPEQRGETLSNLAIIISNLVADFDEQGMVDRAEHFSGLVEKLLRESIEIDNNFTAHVLLANLLIDQGKHSNEVETLLKQARDLASEPTEEAQVYASLGHLAETRGDNRTALGHYQRAAQLHAELPEVWVHIGDLQAKLGQIDQAEQSYLQAIQVAPDESYPYVELASIYTASNRFDKAHDILDQGLMQSEDVELVAAHALSYVYANDLSKAEDYLSEAEEIDPENDLVQNVRRLYDSRKAAQKRAGKPNKSGPNKPNNKKRR